MFLSSRTKMGQAKFLHAFLKMQLFHLGSLALLSEPDDITVFERHLLKGIVNISVAYLYNYSPLAIITADAWCNKTSHNTFAEAVIAEAHGTRKWPAIIFGNSRTVRLTVNNATKPGAVIILLNECDTNNEGLLRLTALSVRESWNQRARYIIISTIVPSCTRDQHRMVRSVLNNSSLLNILHVIFLTSEPVQSQRSNETSFRSPAVEIFTSFPYSPGSKCNDNLNVRLLDRWEEEEDGRGARFMNNVNLFPSKTITNLRGCNVTMAYVAWPPLVMSSNGNTVTLPKFYDEGLEVRIIKTVAETTNFTLHLRHPDKHTKFHGYFGAQWLNSQVLQTCDATRPHFTGAFTWFVPSEREIPRWQSLIKIFNPTFWLLVLLIYILGSVTFWALDNI